MTKLKTTSMAHARLKISLTCGNTYSSHYSLSSLCIHLLGGLPHVENLKIMLLVSVQLLVGQI